MDRLTGMVVFARVVEAQSFTAAAQLLGISKSAVSKAVTALEDRLGARLLQRTTRRIALTEVGLAFYERCVRIVAEAEEAEQAVSHLQAAPRGTLKLNAPVTFGTLHLGPALADFMARYPELSIDLELTDRFVDPLDEGYDVVIRIAETLPDSSLIVRRLTDNPIAICASPAYWREHGMPLRPDALVQHRCITHRYSPSPNEWRFVDRQHKRIAVKVGGRLQTNSGDIALLMALAGRGVARLPRFICGPHLAAGTLAPALAEFMPPPSGIYALYPHNRHLSAKVRAFVDFVVERFGGGCDWDRPEQAVPQARSA